ncbi:MAG: hypothetical protein ACYTGV_18880, partial [Planctomycetota bacterium]
MRTRTGVGVKCPECGHRGEAEDFRCRVCDEPLPRFEDRWAEHNRPVIHVVREEQVEPLKTTLMFVGIGALIAPIFTFTPFLSFMGWFLSSLVHETGHCAVAWAAGCPAIPAISLAGHAMARHSGQSIALCFVIWALIGYLAWRWRETKPLHFGFIGLAAFYPLFAFTGLKEFFFLLGGHLGELTFAAVFFWRAMVGGFTKSSAERVAYATLGWFLVAGNVWLSGGLLFSEEVRAWYRVSGSFGLTNDYIRLARDVMGVGLGAVAFLMLLVSFLPLPAAWLL